MTQCKGGYSLRPFFGQSVIQAVKQAVPIFNVRNDLNPCCAHEGKAGVDESDRR